MTGEPAVKPAESPPTRSDADTAAALYDPFLTYRDDLRAPFTRIADITGKPAAEIEADTREAAETYADAGIAPPQAAQLHGLIARYSQSPPDDATLDKWEIETRKRLRERFRGDEAEVSRRLDRVNQFIEKRPAFSKVLTETGLGSHPEMVLNMVERANELRITPHPMKKANR